MLDTEYPMWVEDMVDGLADCDTEYGRTRLALTEWADSPNAATAAHLGLALLAVAGRRRAYAVAVDMAEGTPDRAAWTRRYSRWLHGLASTLGETPVMDTELKAALVAGLDLLALASEGE